MACTLFWKMQSKWAFIFGTTLSTCAALGIWIGYTYHQSGGYVNLTTLSTNEALAAGNISAIGVPLLLVPLITFIKPDNFDFSLFKLIKQVDDTSFDETHGLHDSKSAASRTADEIKNEEAQDQILLRARPIAIGVSLAFLIFYLILVPLPIYGTNYIFSRNFFTGWIVVTFLWAWFAALVIIFLPLWEGRKGIVLLFSRVLNFLAGKPMLLIEGVNAGASYKATEEPPVGSEKKGASSVRVEPVRGKE